MSIKLEGLEFKIEAKSDDAINNIEALSNSLEKLKNATKGLYGLDNLSNELGKLNKALENFHTENIKKLSHALKSLKNTSNIKIPESLPKRINDIAIASNQLNNSDIDKLERLGNALKSLNATGNVRMLNLQMPNTKASEPATNDIGAVNEVNKGLNNAASTGNTLKSIILKGVGGALSSVSSKVKQISNSFLTLPSMFNLSLGGAINNLSLAFGNFLHQLKRVTLYRIVRTILSQFTQGLLEGINNLYQYSLMMGGTFANSMDRLATSAQYLKNSLGTMAAPIINALAPAIDFLINKIATVLTYINMLFARLSGANSFVIARKSAKNFGKAVGGIGTTAKKAAKGFGKAADDIGNSVKKSAKEIHNATLGIDELNIIMKDNNSDLIGKGGHGRAGGAGGIGDIGGIDYGSMFEEVPISKNISDFIDRLKAAFKHADWKTLGTLIGNKVNEAVESIKFSEIGHKLGFLINGAVQTSYWFLDKVNFKNIGMHIAEFFNSALEEIDFSFIGKLMVKPFTSVIDLIIKFIGTLDFGLVARKISDCMIGIFDELASWLKSYNWFNIGTIVWRKIKDVFENIKYGEIIKSIFNALSSMISTIAKTLGGLVWSAIQDIGNEFGNIGSWFKDIVLSSILKVLSSTKTKLNEAGVDMVSHVKEGWNSACYMKQNIGQFIVGVKNDALSWWHNVYSWWHGVVSNVENFNTNVRNDAPIWWYRVWHLWHGVVSNVENFTTNVQNDAGIWWNNVKAWWGWMVATWGPIGNFTVGVANSIETWWNNIQAWWGHKVRTLWATLNIYIPRIHIGWTKLFGFDVPVPQVVWNAKGGILEGAQLFGKFSDTFLGGGEAGREAILPLDRHTQWMDILAQKVKEGLPNERDKGDSPGMRQVIEYLANMEDSIRRMASDMKRQADKQERTTVQIGSKTIADAVVAQQNANGYRFVR